MMIIPNQKNKKMMINYKINKIIINKKMNNNLNNQLTRI